MQNKIELNDIIISSGTSINSTVYSDTSLWIFGGPSTGTQGQFTKFRLHRFKISESGITDNPTYIKDFIPVQMIATGEIGLYDLVEGKFYSNQGTGSFVAGPERQEV